MTTLMFWFWPWLDNQVGNALNWPLTALTLWTGHTIFHLTGVAATFHPTGSGDTALAWIRALLLVLTALIVCVIWTGISEARGRRSEYRTLHQWLRLGLRLMLALSLLIYGFRKVFPLQFPPPTPEQLAVTYADSSPAGLLWRFMGASPLYSFFGGMAEVIPGLLLLFRRTATLGAIGATAVMLNVVALNLSYDVAVKLYSIELLLVAAFLLLPDLRPMWLIFFKNESAQLARGRVPRSERGALRLAATGIQVVTIGWILHTSGLGAWRMWHDGKTPLSGAWKVDAAGEALAKEGWTSLSTNGNDAVRISKSGQAQYRKVEIDTSGQTLRIFGDWHDFSTSNQTPTAVLHWMVEREGLLLLTGTWQGQPATLRLRRARPDSKLETRGFHWVQEDGLNQ